VILSVFQIFLIQLAENLLAYNLTFLEKLLTPYKDGSEAKEKRSVCQHMTFLEFYQQYNVDERY